MNSPEQYEQVLKELDRNPPQLVVWDPAFNNLIVPIGWPATRLEALARDPVRDFLIERYRPCTSLGGIQFRYVILVEKDRICPTAKVKDDSDGG
jgi:hypothetical protein